MLTTIIPDYLDMLDKKIYFDGLGEVSFRKTARSRNIRIRISERISVTMPAYCRYGDAAMFVKENMVRILKARQKYLEKTANAARPMPEMRIPDEWGLSGEEKAELLKPDPDKEILRRIARKTLVPRLAALSGMHPAFKYRSVRIKDNKSNWGSCSVKKNINLNMNLVRLPGHLADFVMLHELSHLAYMNHGEQFHAMLDSLTAGKEKQFAKELRKYSWMLRGNQA